MKITLTTIQATALSKALKPAIGTDPIRNHLTTVQVSTTGDYATFTATDGYRLHRITVPQTDITECVTFNVAGKELVTNLALFAKSNGSGDGTVTLEHMHGLMMKSSSSMVVVVDIIDREFPNCGAILDADPETEDTGHYSAEYLSDIILAASYIYGTKRKGDDSHGRVEIVNIHPRKPMHVRATSNATGMTFAGVVMPQRVGR